MGIQKNFLYSLALTGTNYIFPIIVYPYISRVLGVDNIGLVNFIDSIINYLVLFSMMGLNIVGIREIASSKSERQKMDTVFSSLLTLNIIGTLIAVAVLSAITLYVPQLRENAHLMGIGALKLIGNLFLIEWFYNGLENFRFISLRTIFVRASYVVSVFIFVRRQSDIQQYYLLTCLMTVLNATINFLYSGRYVSFKLSLIKFRPFIIPFLTSGLYMILTSMYTTFNITYLGFVSNDTQVGYYYTASRLYYIFAGIFTAFTNVMLPRMSRLISDGDMVEFSKKINQSFEILMVFALPVVIGVFIFANEIIQLISGPGYEGAVLPLRIIIVLIIIIGYEQILVMQALIPMKKDRTIFINSAIGAIVALSLNIVLVKATGAIGSSIMWVCSESVIFILSVYALRKILGKNLNIFSPLKFAPLFLLLIPILILIHMIPLNYIVTLAIAIIVTFIYTGFTILRLLPESNTARILTVSIIKRLKNAHS